MTIPKPLPKEGFAVPLKASFLVLKRLTWLGITHSNGAPRLTLFEDRLEYRVLTLTRKNYAEIEAVDARQWIATQTAILGWRGRMLAFAGNLGAEDARLALLEFFEARGVALTPRARKILSSGKNRPR